MAIKVLYLFEFFNFGGIERLMNHMARHTPKSKVGYLFFTYETEIIQGIGKELAEDGYKVHFMKKGNGHDLGVWKKLFELQKREKFDIGHTHAFGPLKYAVPLKFRFLT